MSTQTKYQEGHNNVLLNVSILPWSTRCYIGGKTLWLNATQQWIRRVERL